MASFGVFKYLLRYDTASWDERPVDCFELESVIKNGKQRKNHWECKNSEGKSPPRLNNIIL